MARYIDADKLESELFRDGIAGIFLDYPRRRRYTIGEIRGMLKNERIAPTADVAPKSEVAREIFEELYKSVASKITMQIRPIFKDDLNFEDGFRNGKTDAFLEVLLLIAELKKKYIGEQTNERPDKN